MIADEAGDGRVPLASDGAAPSIRSSQHKWVKSTLGHGEQMCAKCFITNREAAALGQLDGCPELDDDAAEDDRLEDHWP